MNKKVFILVVMVLSVLLPTFSQSALASRYLMAANDQYIVRNNAKAFTYINYVLEQYQNDTLPDNVSLLAEAIYYDYLNEAKNDKNLEAFRDVQNRLIEFPYLATTRMNRLLSSASTMFIALAETEEMNAKNSTTEKAAAATAQAIISANDELYKKFESLTEVQQNFSKQLQDSQQEMQNRQEEMLGSMISEIQNGNEKTVQQTGTIVFILLFAVGLLAVIILIVIIVTMKISRRQQEMFTETLRVVSELQRIPLESAGNLRLTDVYSGMRAIEDSSIENRRPALEDFDKKEVNDNLRQELRELASECEKQGIQIDKVTGRKNNSKNVAELIFKIAQKMNYGEYFSMLYFCASMVYDIGFLGIDQNLLEAESLTEEEKYAIRSHVRHGAEKLDFVPEKYRPVFMEAVLMHHENLDGSGYPDGLVNAQIPPIARMIRVVESFIAQISKRNYHGIFDKETAMAELKNHPEWYDQKIIEILDSLI